MGGGWEGAMGTPKRRLGERGEGSGYGAVSRKLKYLRRVLKATRISEPVRREMRMAGRVSPRNVIIP